MLHAALWPLGSFRGFKILQRHRVARLDREGSFKLANRRVMQSLLVVEHTQIIVGEEISRLKIDGFSVCLHRIFYLMRALISIRQVEASGKVFGIQTEGPLKLGDGAVRLALFEHVGETSLGQNEDDYA